MYISNPPPSGVHYAYVFKVRGKDTYKIGCSKNLSVRRKGIQSRRLRLHEYYHWRFESFFPAFCVEQLLIQHLKRFGFGPHIGSDDWFDIDKPTIEAAIEITTELATAINAWEDCNWGLECFAKEGTPWGDHWNDEWRGPDWRERRKRYGWWRKAERERQKTKRIAL